MAEIKNNGLNKNRTPMNKKQPCANRKTAETPDWVKKADVAITSIATAAGGVSRKYVGTKKSVNSRKI
ncbi:hypothetical protein D3C85_1805020 [compost metagenome]